MNEISAENRDLLNERHRVAAIIAVAQIVFTFVLATVGWIMVPGSAFTVEGSTVTSLWVLIAFLAIGGVFLRRLFFSWERLRNAALVGGIDGLLKNVQNSHLILGAFAELIAIVGFVIAMFTASFFDLTRAIAIALVVFLVTFPRKKKWATIVASLQDS